MAEEQPKPTRKPREVKPKVQPEVPAAVPEAKTEVVDGKTRKVLPNGIVITYN